MLQTILAVSWAFFISLFAVPSIIQIAHLKNILDTPNQRTVHESLIPRLGGLAVFAGFMSALTIFGNLGNGVQQLMAGCVILFFIGLKDDLITISALKKFFVQLLATGIVMFMADIRISSFQGILGINELTIGLSYAFTFLVIVGITNAINLIDGLDGLAGSMILISSVTFGVYFLNFGGEAYGNYALVAFCLVGGVLGFLRFNFFKATIFMGDTGSLVCGFIISILAIQFIEMRPVANSTPAIGLSVLFIPLFDTLRISIIRISKGISPFTPDKNHVHHRILAMGFSQISTVIILSIINIGVILFAVSFTYLGNNWLILSLVGVSVALSLILGVNKPKRAQAIT